MLYACAGTMGNLGRGCINITQKRGKSVKAKLTILCLEACEQLANILNRYVNVKMMKPRKLSKTIIYALVYSSKEDVEKIINYIYRDATIYLKRKYDSAMKPASVDLAITKW